MGSSRYRGRGGRGRGRSAPLPPRIDENPQDYELWNPQGRVPTPPGPTPPGWPRSAGESSAAFGAGYLNAYEETRPEAPGNFPSRVRRRNRLLTTAAVVAVALLAGVAIFLIRHSGGKAGHAPGPASAASRKPDAGATHGASIGPRAISAALIFPHAHVVARGITFHRVTAVLNRQCALTARGAFAKALKSGGCHRVVRATFVDSAKRYAVTAGVAGLSSPVAAKAANRSMNFGPDVWFTGLDGPARSGATVVSKSVGLGYDTVYGRYIVYALATYSDGRNPAGHAAAVKTLKDLARSFGVMARQPLAAQAGRSRA